MSAIFTVDERQINAVLNELTTVENNINTQIKPDVEAFMGEVQDVAIHLTHFISHNLQAAWDVKATQSGTAITVTLFNPLEYAEEEFSRPGVKESVGTSHDVRPEINDKTIGGIENVVFTAITKNLR